MNPSIFSTLQQDFITIRYLLSDDCYDEERFCETTDNIKKIRDKITKKASVEGRKIILYCIDTLFEIIAEQNRAKLFDFADTIHNMPEICLGKRNIYSFHEEILLFQKKYGKGYFAFYRKAKPKFQKQAPKNIRYYFLPESDDTFKALHPTGYKVLLGVGLTVLFLPMILYCIYVLFINPAPEEWTMLLGVVGAFIIGIGLYNLVAAWIHQYLGHLVTIVCIVGGVLLTAFSLFFLYT